MQPNEQQELRTHFNVIFLRLGNAIHATKYPSTVNNNLAPVWGRVGEAIADLAIWVDNDESGESL